MIAAALALSHAPTPGQARADGSEAAGELLFRDSFDKGLGPEWKVDRDGVWTVVDGRLRANLPNSKQAKSCAYAGSDRWGDYVVEFDVLGMRGVDKGVAVRVDGDRRGIGFDLRSDRYNDIVMYRGYEHCASAAVTNRNGVWYHVRIEVRKNRYRVFVDGTPAIDFTDETNSRPRGRIALAAYAGGVGECEVMYDNVEVRALP